MELKPGDTVELTTMREHHLNGKTYERWKIEAKVLKVMGGTVDIKLKNGKIRRVDLSTLAKKD